MVWSSKWSGHIKSGWYDNLLKQGLLREDDFEPDIGPFRFYFDAFRELDSCRSVGMAVGQIPFTAIVEYSRLYEVGNFQEFLAIIRRLDHEFLEATNKKSESKGK